MKAEEKAQELYPNNSTFCGGVAQIARDAFAKGARMQKEVDDKELSEKVSAAHQLGLSDKEKQMAEGLDEEVERIIKCEKEFMNFQCRSQLIGYIARHFAKWQYQKDREKFAQIKAKTWSEGFDACKEQMMEEAVEADVNIYRDIVAGKSWAEFVAEMPTNNLGEKVRIIIVKEEKDGTGRA